MNLAHVAVATAAVMATLAPTPADAAVDFTLRVHAQPGRWAFEPDCCHRKIVAPDGTPAAAKMRAADPGDVFILSGQTQGRFAVVGTLSIVAPFYTRQMHVKGTRIYVYLGRV